jgi:GxxExxY protein
VIGAAFEVHKFLGNGFQEVIYQRALAYEMREAGHLERMGYSV